MPLFYYEACARWLRRYLRIESEEIAPRDLLRGSNLNSPLPGGRLAANAEITDLTVVVPAYNEEERLPDTLAELAEFFDEGPGDVELILVDDGSTDSTLEIMRGWCAGRAYAREVGIEHAGKAHAVRVGVAEAGRGRVLFMDADLAVPLPEIWKLISALDEGAEVAIGSRELAGGLREGESFARHLRGRLFNWFVAMLAVRGIRDTQCGFKAFETPVARHIFAESRLYSQAPIQLSGPRVTAFDVELLFLARRLRYTIAEVGVNWRHVPNSKVDPIRDPLQMALEVVRIRLNALLGRYP